MNAAGIVMQRLLIFAAAGAVGTAAQYLVLIALVEGCGGDAVTASAVGFAVGAAVNYGINRRFVFRSQRSHAQALTRFLTVAAAGFLVNGLLMTALTRRADWPYMFAQIATTGMLLLFHYAAHATWTFRNHPPRSGR